MSPPKAKVSTVARYDELGLVIRCEQCGPTPLGLARTPQIAKEVVNFHRKSRQHEARVEKVTRPRR